MAEICIACGLVGFISTIITKYPFFMNICAIPAPIPEEDPVINATSSLMSNSELSNVPHF